MRAVSLVGAAGVLLAGAACARAGFMNQYGVIVGGKYDTSQSVSGSALVGGNLTSNSSNYGIGLPAGSKSIDSLVVVGILTGNVQVNNGSNARIREIGKEGKVNLNGGGGTLFQGADAADAETKAAAAFEEMKNTSAYFSRLSTGGSTIKYPDPSNQNDKVRLFTAVPTNGAAVFDVMEGLLTASNAVFELAAGSGVTATTSFVFNVPGKDVSVGGFERFAGLFTDPNRLPFVIWNFYEAETVTLNKDFIGAVLAPNAKLTNWSKSLGSVFVGEFDQRSQVDFPYYQGIVAGPSPAAVPEPSSLALLGIAGLGMGGAAWRKRRRLAGGAS